MSKKEDKVMDIFEEIFSSEAQKTQKKAPAKSALPPGKTVAGPSGPMMGPSGPMMGPSGPIMGPSGPAMGPIRMAPVASAKAVERPVPQKIRFSPEILKIIYK